MVVILSNRNCILCRYFIGKMPPVLACRALSQISVFCGRSNGRVQHATVYSAGIQGYRCKGKLTWHYTSSRKFKRKCQFLSFSLFFFLIFIIIRKTLGVYFLQAINKKQIKLLLNEWGLCVRTIDFIQI